MIDRNETQEIIKKFDRLEDLDDCILYLPGAHGGTVSGLSGREGIALSRKHGAAIAEILKEERDEIKEYLNHTHIVHSDENTE